MSEDFERKLTFKLAVNPVYLSANRIKIGLDKLLAGKHNYLYYLVIPYLALR